jgi:type VI secretion system secreted protein VgrG
MSATLFEPRPLAVATPLGPDALQLLGVHGTEGLSQLFRLELDAVAKTGRRIPFEALLGQTIGVRIQLADAPPRMFFGICSRISQGERDTQNTSYRLEVVPQLWFLTQGSGLRLFPDVSVPDVLERVFTGQDASFELRVPYPVRELLVQYRESDFDFVSRLLAEEGIFYFFEHTADGHKLVVGDSPESHPELPAVQFDARAAGRSVYSWEKTQELAAGKTRLRDHDFESPQGIVEGEAAIQESALVGSVEHALRLDANESLELYDFPGAYAQRFDGVGEAERAARIRMEAHAAASLAVTGASTVPWLAAGHRFRLERHGDGDGAYVLTGVSHTARLADSKSTKLSYSNTFTCIPAGLPFRPPRTTPRPMVGGLQTAIVVGPAGGGVFVDDLGRVKVRFYWDRAEQSSAWVRVAQPYTRSSGAFWLPGVDDEVLVGFEHGDPHRPYVVGRLWNTDDRPPEDRDDEEDPA